MPSKNEVTHRHQSSTMRTSILPSTPPVQLHQSVASLVDRYDAFILDQFGVLHNGAHALEGAVNCIQQLAHRNKKLVILSNTSGPAQAALQKLPTYGFDKDCFLGAITSGEESSKYLRETYGNNNNNNSSSKPKRALWFTWDGTTGNYPTPADYLNQCGNLEIAQSVEEADLVLAHGAHVWKQSSSDQVSLGSFFETGQTDQVIDPLLQKCVKRNLPMVCANPDFTVRMPDGSKAYMPGNLARRYEELGGTCRSFGKPHAEHFEACLDLLGVDASKAIHVGDSLHHDICGANAAKIDSLWITSSGVHCEELQADFGILPEEARMMDLLQREGHYPTHAMAAFRF